MLARVETATVVGLTAIPVTVEVDVTDGLPRVTIVGLPDTTVRESKERIKSALKNTQFAWPGTRVLVNLAPADVKKEGSAFDFPIALGLLAASHQLEPERFADVVALGELALDGSLRPIPGVLPIALSLRGSPRCLLVPEPNAMEAALCSGVPVYPIRQLSQAVRFLRGQEVIAPAQGNPEEWIKKLSHSDGLDFSEVKGQFLAKRALEVAVAGSHNILLIGPPGSGKTMLAQRIPTIMPPMSLEEALETTTVYSVVGLLSPHQPLVTTRPFRIPHSTISDAGLVGGGTHPRLGEISLAHNGVLFMDELPEFNRDVLETLRQPLEEGRITISRAQGTSTFPARFMLVASMNPCPCGFSGDLTKSCLCSPGQIHRYRTKISGPLLDRIDLHLEVPAVALSELTGDGEGESSASIRARIAKARMRQSCRFKEEPRLFANAQMRHRHLKWWCRIQGPGRDLLKKAIVQFGLSARAYDRILKVSRTIADLAGSEEISAEYLAEAIQYRALDRATWA